MPTAIVIGVTSDIGRELANRFIRDGWSVSGTYRDAKALGPLAGMKQFVQCDLSSTASVAAAAQWLVDHAASWDLLVIAAGTEEPIGSFWDCSPDDWDAGIRVNALAPLALIRALYPTRNTEGTPSVALFSGAGTNGPARAYSAYCGSKVFLVKMCELLDDESPDTSFFILGPGIVRTRIHQQTLNAAARAGQNYNKVVDFLSSGNPGTSHDDIYACLKWCIGAGKSVIGGRNISVVNDSWRNGGQALARWLTSDRNRYKLRRNGNDERIGAGE